MDGQSDETATDDAPRNPAPLFKHITPLRSWQKPFHPFDATASGTRSWWSKRKRNVNGRGSFDRRC